MLIRKKMLIHSILFDFLLSLAPLIFEALLVAWLAFVQEGLAVPSQPWVSNQGWINCTPLEKGTFDIVFGGGLVLTFLELTSSVEVCSDLEKRDFRLGCLSFVSFAVFIIGSKKQMMERVKKLQLENTNLDNSQGEICFAESNPIHFRKIRF